MKTESVTMAVYAVPSEYSSAGYCLFVKREFPGPEGEVEFDGDYILLKVINIDLEINEGDVIGQLIDKVESGAAKKLVEAQAQINATKDRILEKLRTLPAPISVPTVPGDDRGIPF